MGLEALLSQQIIGLSESIDDRVAALLVAGTGITLTYNDGAGTLTIASSGGGSIGGSTGSTDNRILRADGTGGATVQNSAVTIDDSGNISGLGTVGCGAITSGSINCSGITGTQVIQTNTNGFACSIGGNGYRFLSGGYFICSSNGVFKFSDNADTSFGRLQLGGTTSSFPAIKRNSAAINFRLADDSADCNITAATATLSALLFVGAYTVATLPAAASNTGALAQATDSSVTTNGSTVAGGGANRVFVFSNGTNWKVIV